MTDSNLLSSGQVTAGEEATSSSSTSGTLRTVGTYNQLEIVNRVLRRMREEAVLSTTDNTYACLMAEFVADAYSQVLEEHDWEALKHRIRVDVVSGASLYDLSNLVANGGNVRDTDRRAAIDSELQYLQDCPQVWMYDSDSDDTPDYIEFLSPEQFRAMKGLDRDDTDTDPCYMTIYPKFDPTDSMTKLYMDLYPTPSATKVIEIVLWSKPERLLWDGTTDTVNLLVPDRPVYHLALMYAYNERGEEMGEPGSLAERRFSESLGSAIEKDTNSAQRTDRYDWRRD